MLTYATWKLLHLTGIFVLFLSLGGVLVHAAAGGEARHPARGLVLAAHGLGTLLVLLGGFGMLAKLGFGGMPGWVFPKVAIWLVLAMAVSVPYRRPGFAKPLFLALPILGAIAAYIGMAHP